MTFSMKVPATKSQLLSCLSAVVITCALVSSANSADAPAAAKAGPAKMHLLTQQQYRQVIADTFGPDIEVNGQFATELRKGGLLAVSSGETSVTGGQLQAFDSMARAIAAQVTDPQRRQYLVSCKPANERGPDAACATEFFKNTGRILFRRPLTEQEVQLQVNVAGEAATKVRNFYDGLGFSLASMLVAPEFLFRQETVKASADGHELDDYSKASRLSFFLWNAQPDGELLRAAVAGELSTPAGIAKQVDRMVASRRFEGAVRNFFADMLRFDEYEHLQKDATVFPKFTLTVSAESEEQTLRTLVDLLVTNKGDYRDIFTTRKTFLTTTLAAIYNVSLVKTTASMEPPAWQAVEYPEGDARTGVLSHISFTALHSHPGRTSPTIRGKALREVFLCQKVPDPPANVNFEVVQDTSNPQFKTARDRVTAHMTTPACAGCHKVMDPMGLSLETFDGAGSYRTTENGVTIATDGAFNGKPFKDSMELNKVLHDDPAITSCVVQRAVAYGLGREIADGEKPWYTGLTKTFATDQYRLPDLFRRIANSPEFFRVAEPQQTAVKSAAAN